ncbi:hypothetical protein T4D_9239 [Trichinella pseudospiralis]|uniref:Uncharacterized protein n=1 Tax=Trichinella pseudospiralis TaxID=6337 RepID=A0A0V1DKH6_TRIPS|nr:hypothetical protein T4D_9239 [Trichinella pseudospiralis]
MSKSIKHHLSTLLVGVVLAAVCAFSGRSQCYVDLCCRLDMHGSSLLDWY